MKTIKKINKHKILFSFIFYFFSTVFITFPLITDTNILKANDMNGNLVNLIYIKESLLSTGIFPFWNPYLNQGIPITADPLNPSFNPLVLITFIVLPINIFLKSVYFVSIFLAGFFFYLLLRILKIKNNIALLLPLTLMSSGYIVSRIYAGHLEKILTYPLVPLLFISIIILLNRANLFWSGITALTLTLFIMSGATYEFFYALIIIASVLLFALIKYLYTKSVLAKKQIIFTSLALPLTFLFSSFKIIPMLEIAPYISHVKTPFSGSQNIISITLNLFYPFVDNIENTIFLNYLNFPFYWWERFGFIGFLPILCLVLIPFIYKKYKHISLFIFLLISSTLFTMMDHPLNPYKWIFENIEFIQQFRIPSRMFIFVIPIMLVLSAFSLDHLSKYKKLNILIIILILLNFVSVYRIFYEKLSKETFVYTAPIAEHEKSLDFLKEYDNELFFIGQSPLFQERVKSKKAVLNNQRVLYHNYGFHLEKDYSSNLLDSNYKGVYPKYFIFTSKRKPPESLALIKIDTNIPNSFIYKKEYYSNYIDIYNADEDSLTYKKNHNPIVTNTTIKPNTISFDLNSDKKNNKVLVLESYAPGWSAKIDNKKIKLNKDNFLSVNIETGYHAYKFTYLPTAFYLGVFTTLLSIIAFVLIITKKRVFKEEYNYFLSKINS